jgi:hypothetical protein
LILCGEWQQHRVGASRPGEDFGGGERKKRTRRRSCSIQNEHGNNEAVIVRFALTARMNLLIGAAILWGAECVEREGYLCTAAIPTATSVSEFAGGQISELKTTAKSENFLSRNRVLIDGCSEFSSRIRTIADKELYILNLIPSYE